MMEQTMNDSIESGKSSGMNEIVIDIKNLKISFGQQDVLKDVSFQLHRNENLVVLGKSGTGKSVLIKCIVRLLNADSGTICVFDKNVPGLNRTELGLLRQKIGFLFQSGALYDSMTVKQNLEFPLRRLRKGFNEKQIAAKINEVLESVGLADSINKLPSQLSGGMRKRISLARTIVIDPGVILYDEPTTGLDPVTSDEISKLINQIQKQYKAASIIITHDIKCAENTADRLIMLNDGVIYKEGDLNSFKTSTDPVIAAFFN